MGRTSGWCSDMVKNFDVCSVLCGLVTARQSLQEAVQGRSGDAESTVVQLLPVGLFKDDHPVSASCESCESASCVDR